MARRPSIDLSATIAVAWIWVAVGLTVVFGPQLGLRGLLWLALHHILCIAGVTHELRQYQKRQRQLSASATGAPSPAADPDDDPAAAPALAPELAPEPAPTAPPQG